MQAKALTVIFIAGVALAASGLAYAQSQIVKGDSEHAMTQNSHANHPAPVPSGNPAVRAYQEANDRMHADMTIDFTGDADVDFMRAMIAHHEGEIALARIQLQHGSDKDARGLAQDLIRARDTEILRMRLWLARRETQPAPESGA